MPCHLALSIQNAVYTAGPLATALTSEQINAVVRATVHEIALSIGTTFTLADGRRIVVEAGRVTVSGGWSTSSNQQLARQVTDALLDAGQIALAQRMGAALSDLGQTSIAQVQVEDEGRRLPATVLTLRL